MSIPDRIAYTRMILVPPIVALVLAAEHIDHAYGYAALLMAIAAFTDWLDGFLARRWNITTILGGFLDTIADKLLVAGTLFALVEVGRTWAWAGFIIVAREIAISGLRSIAAMDGVQVPPSIWGKWKATIQYVAIFMALGVLCAFLVSMLFLPACLSLLPPTEEQVELATAERRNPLLTLCAELAVQRRPLVYAVCLVLTAIGVYGLLQVTNDVYQACFAQAAHCVFGRADPG